MTIISILPFFYIDDLNLSIYSFCIVLGLGIWFSMKSIMLYLNVDDRTAKKLMVSSFAYLPLVQIIYVIDKFIF